MFDLFGADVRGHDERGFFAVNYSPLDNVNMLVVIGSKERRFALP